MNFEDEELELLSFKEDEEGRATFWMMKFVLMLNFEGV